MSTFLESAPKGLAVPFLESAPRVPAAPKIHPEVVLSEKTL